MKDIKLNEIVKDEIHEEKVNFSFNVDDFSSNSLIELPEEIHIRD